MEEIKEDEQIPNEFYRRLNKPEDASKLKELITNIAELSLSFVSKEESKKLLAQLARNIRLITSDYPDNYVKRCRDINYWFHEQIKTCKTECDKGLSSDSTAVFNDIKWKKENGERVCERKEHPYSSGNAKLMKKLDDYCEIRDNNECNAVTNKNQCIKCNKYIKKKKEEFTNAMEGICKKDCGWDKYTIACRCTLNDMDLTFPVKNCDELFKEPEIKKHSFLEIGFFVIFTPVGSILNRFRKRKYDIKRHIGRVGDDRYSLYHSDEMPADSENKRYYIEYARQYN
ncbi:unnamed protein product [Plasmodium vivax]|uniref:(malaria parasite P. vivax) hypothetical protein n=1 Tax=Plasmodium vivax TaxID=5855 RepID=A0A8S4HKE4_PLAVI|nr:unnamed protein product [Plasmodium vivax]